MWTIAYIKDKDEGSYILIFLSLITVYQFLLGLFVAQINGISLAEEFAVRTAAGDSTLRNALMSLFATCTVGLITIIKYFMRDQDDE